MGERLNKVLARAGVASRRGADELIQAGRVTVNGQVVRELGSQVDAGRDAVKVDGKRIPAIPESHTYLMLNKPRGYVTTLKDPEGRPTVKDLVADVRGRLFPVGRLDFHSEGLLLMTDDGELSRRLTHPSSEVRKTYSVKVRGTPSPAALSRLRQGVRIEGRRTRPAGVRLVKPGANPWLEVTIHEGRKHQVRLMLASEGHRVLRLRRIRFAGIGLGDLAVGALRPLTASELARLHRAAGGTGRSRRPSKKPPSRAN